MSGDRVKGWIETLWPIAVVVGAVLISWSSFQSRLASADGRSLENTRAINGVDGHGGLRDDIGSIKSELANIRTILDERLPKKGP